MRLTRKHVLPLAAMAPLSLGLAAIAVIAFYKTWQEDPELAEAYAIMFSFVWAFVWGFLRLLDLKYPHGRPRK